MVRYNGTINADYNIYLLRCHQQFTATIPRLLTSPVSCPWNVESRRGNKYTLITNYRGYIHFTLHPKILNPTLTMYNPSPPSSPSSLPTLCLYRASFVTMRHETSLECREYYLSQRLPVQFVPPQMHRSNPAEKLVKTSKNHLIATFASTHPDFPDDLWDRLFPHAELTLNV
jgi:hypothetical protein